MSLLDSQVNNKKFDTTTQSDFIESSYSHNSDWNESATGALSTHYVGGVDDTEADGYSTRTTML